MITITITAIAVFVPLLIAAVYWQVRTGIELSKDRMGADVMLIANTNDFEDTALLFSGTPLRRYIKREDLGFLGGFQNQIEMMTEQFFTHTLTDGCCTPNEKLRVVGVDNNTDFLIKPWLRQNGLNGIDADSVIVGADVIYQLGERITLFNKPFYVAGNLYRTGTGMDMTVFMRVDRSRDLAREMFPKSVFWGRDPNDLASSIFLKLNEGVDPSGFAAMINTGQQNIYAAARADTLGKLESSIAGWLLVVRFLAGAIGIVAVLSLFGRFTALLKERKREFGYLRSLGFSAGRIFRISFLEVALMSLAGGALAGLAAVVLIGGSLEFVSVQFVLPRANLSASFLSAVFAAGPLTALVLGFFTSVVPAAKSASREPKDAMIRGEV